MRQTFHRLLNSSYKHCDTLGWHDEWTPKSEACPKRQYTEYGLPICQSKYKFTISMENTFSYGYVSEKLFSSLFAGSMPIYFGASDISRYINLDRIIFCHVNEIIINRMRFIFNLLGRERIKFTFTNEQMIKFGIAYLKDDLMKCVEQVIQVDQNDSLYEWKMMQPVFRKNKIKNTFYDHTSVAQSVIDVLRYLESPLFTN